MKAQKISIHVSKAALLGVAVSVVVMIGAGLVLAMVVNALPFTPEHQMNDFLTLNNNNPIAYSTKLVQNFQHESGLIDAFIVTPLTMILAGYAMPKFLPKASWPIQRILRAALIAGVAVATCVLLAGLGLTDLVQYKQGETESSFDYRTVPFALLQILPSAFAYVLGAWIGARTRKMSTNQLGSATVSNPTLRNINAA